MKAHYEMTDTFSGGANYCWVKRGTVELPDNASDLAIVRAVKKALDLSGVRCRKSWDAGDAIRYDIAGACICFFITFDN